MLARYANVRNYDRVLKTWNWLGSYFGASGEFTAKEFNNVKKDYPRNMFCSLKFLEEEGIIKVIRSEKTSKEIALDPWKAETYIVDKNGNRLMTDREYYFLPEVAKKALLAMNGKDFAQEQETSKVVTSEKFVYAPDPDGMFKWRKKYCALLTTNAMKIDERIEKLAAKRNVLLACD